MKNPGKVHTFGMGPWLSGKNPVLYIESPRFKSQHLQSKRTPSDLRLRGLFCSSDRHGYPPAASQIDKTKLDKTDFHRQPWLTRPLHVTILCTVNTHTGEVDPSLWALTSTSTWLSAHEYGTYAWRKYMNITLWSQTFRKPCSQSQEGTASMYS